MHLFNLHESEELFTEFFSIWALRVQRFTFENLLNHDLNILKASGIARSS